MIPAVAQNDDVVSINNAMEVNLTGQVKAEVSKSGKSIIALKSAYRDHNGTLHSEIRTELPLGSIVTTLRTWVQYVVTKYGVANFKY